MVERADGLVVSCKDWYCCSDKQVKYSPVVSNILADQRWIYETFYRNKYTKK